MSLRQPLQKSYPDPEPIREGNPGDGRQSFLLVRAAPRVCAIPVSSVVETMRPLPIQAVQGMPEYVAGVAIIRGQTVPVVRLATLLGDSGAAVLGRLVSIRVDGRQVALGVEAVIGVRRFDPSAVRSMPPLLQNAASEVIAGIGSVDGELLLVLQASRLLPADTCDELDGHQDELRS